MVQSIPTKQGEESSGNPNMNDLYTLCHYVSIIPYLYLKWQANNKSKMSWKLKSLGALEWPSTGLTCYHLHDPPFMAWDMAINPCWLHSPNYLRWGTPKNRPQNWFILAATNRFFWTSLLNNDINASAGSRPTACQKCASKIFQPCHGWDLMIIWLACLIYILGFLGFMNDLMGFHSDLGIGTFLFMFYPDLDKAIDSTWWIHTQSCYTGCFSLMCMYTSIWAIFIHVYI